MIFLFDQHNDPGAGANLHSLLSGLGSAPLLGLLITVRPDGSIANWRFADTQDLKALALVLPEQAETEQRNEDPATQERQPGRDRAADPAPRPG